MTDGLGAVACLVRRLLPDGPCSVRVCLPWGRVVARREQLVSEPGLEPGTFAPVLVHLPRLAGRACFSVFARAALRG